MTERTRQIREYFLTLEQSFRAAPYKNYLWPRERGDLDGLFWLREKAPETWRLLPAKFRRTFYEYDYRFNRRQRFKAIGSDEFKDFGAPPFEKPAPDAPAVTS